MSDEEQLYCICRSPDIDRFMIMCDHCEEWYHGDCIKISERKSRFIKYFYCDFCCKKNPLLKTIFRKQKKVESEGKEKKHKQKQKKSHGSSHDPSSKHGSSGEKSMKEHHKIKKEVDVNKFPSFNQKKMKAESSSTISETIKQEKIKPQRKLIISDDDEEDDMDFTHAKSGDRQSEKSCYISPTKDSTSIQLKQQTTNKSSKKKQQQQTNKKKKCGNCDNCLREEDCGCCDICHDIEKYGPSTNPNEICRLRRCFYEDDDIIEEPKPIIPKKSHPKVLNSSHIAMKRQAEADKTYVVEKPSKSSSHHRSAEKKQEKKDKKKKKRKMENEIATAIIDQHQQPSSKFQCLGPQCTQPSRINSKYCSSECGQRLAHLRLITILPQRTQAWNSSPTVADEIARNELERIRSQMVIEKKELERLEERFRKLEEVIVMAKKLKVDEASDLADVSDETDHNVILCVICGQSTSIRNATKHMDRCYNKTEAQTSFGSIFPTKIDGVQRLFCDVLNVQQRTYCKRLQVLCPEHTKEAKVMDDEVCGCPLDSDKIYSKTFEFKSESFCRQSKKKCNKHFKWETMFRAEVDLQRIRQWLKIDEIFDEERKIRTAMSNRAGVLSLLLHETIKHDPTCNDMRTKPTVSKKPAYKLMI